MIKNAWYLFKIEPPYHHPPVVRIRLHQLAVQPARAFHVVAAGQILGYREVPREPRRHEPGSLMEFLFRPRATRQHGAGLGLCPCSHQRLQFPLTRAELAVCQSASASARRASCRRGSSLSAFRQALAASPARLHLRCRLARSSHARAVFGAPGRGSARRLMARSRQSGS